MTPNTRTHASLVFTPTVQLCHFRPPTHLLSSFYILYLSLSHIYLEDHVSRQQSSIPGNDAFSVDVLDKDAHKRSLISPHDADGQRLTGVAPCDLNRSDFTIRDKMMELRQSKNCREGSKDVFEIKKMCLYMKDRFNHI